MCDLIILQIFLQRRALSDKIFLFEEKNGLQIPVNLHNTFLSNNDSKRRKEILFKMLIIPLSNFYHVLVTANNQLIRMSGYSQLNYSPMCLKEKKGSLEKHNDPFK